MTVKAQSMLLIQVIIGVIIAISILIFAFTVGRNILVSEEDWDGSFQALGETIQTLSETGLNGAQESYLLKIEQDTAIIGLSPQAEEPNGRFGDGWFHLYYKHYTYATITTPNPRLYHFPRPASCTNSSSCLCLCQNPVAYHYSNKDIKDKYDEALFIPDKDKDNPYNYPPYDTYQETLLTNPTQHYYIECSHVSCQKTGESSYYSPFMNKDFLQYEGETDQPYFMENGFAVFRTTDIGQEGDSKNTGGSILGYDQELPAAVPLYLSKLGNQLVVCMTPECLDRIEQAQNEKKQAIKQAEKEQQQDNSSSTS